MKFSRAELEAFRGEGIPDLVGPGSRLLFVGFNPGLRSAATQAPFSLRSNRFWPTLYASGILDRDIIATNGLDPDDRAYILERGIGITSLVKSATARASELSREQLVTGASALAERVAQWRPSVVAILGVTAYRIAFERPDSGLGRQPETIGGSTAWVVPNPSGLNAHTTRAELAETYRAAAVAAGIDLFPRA